MANKVWETIFQDRGKISARGGYPKPDFCRICGNNKSKAKRNKAGQTVCEATKKHCKENQSIQEGIIMIDKVWSKWNGLNKKAKIAIIVIAVVAVAWVVK